MSQAPTMCESSPSQQAGVGAACGAAPGQPSAGKQWFVMRDLKRANAKLPAYRLLGAMGMETFTPMVWKLALRRGRRCRERVPFMPDMLFVHSARQALDPVVEKENTLQYRYVRGGYKVPMTVREADMQRFIRAVESSDDPCFFTPGEVTPGMLGMRVRIIGGPLDGYEGCLQKMQGSRAKRLFVELPGIITASVEVQPEYIQIIKK